MDLQVILLWWVWLLIIGLVFLPISAFLFHRFFDKGYLFAKTIGLIMLSYAVWLLSSLKLLAFTRTSIYIVLVLGLATSIAIIIRMRKKGMKYLPELHHLKYFVLEEMIFLSGLSLWSYLRGLKPEIQGLEKFMDLGFVNAVLRADYMPPMDMWYGSSNINYYYFGHYITAFLTRLTGIPSEITYNLMMSTLFSFCFALTFSLVANMGMEWKGNSKRHGFAAGILSATLISLSGNLHTFFFTMVLPALKNIGFPISSKIDIQKNYWFPDATRYIGYNPPLNDKTIHEFPLYSFVVSDLHAHVINIPFVLTLLALLFALLVPAIQRIREGHERESGKRGESPSNSNPLHKGLKDGGASLSTSLYSLFPPHLLLIAMFIGTFQMTNYWDFPIYLTVTGMVLVYINLLKFRFGRKAWIQTAIQGAGILAFSLLVSLPFNLKFVSITNGIGLTHSHSPISQLFVLWGYQIILAIWFVILLLYQENRHIMKPRIKLPKGQPRTAKAHQKKLLWVRLADVLLELRSTDVFVFILSLSAAGLVLMPELVYVRDIYQGAYYRSNTMFKLTYQSFMMFSLAIGYIVIRLITHYYEAVSTTNRGGGSLTSGSKATAKKVIPYAVIALSIFAPMMYPFYAINSWYNPGVQQYKGLDGLAFMKEQYPDDYKAVQWLRDNIPGRVVVLEANGDSYTDYGRISMSTGLPTIQGWYTHEWLWRNDRLQVEARIKEVSQIYESDDVAATKTILEKYDVKYIVIGKLERDKFKNLNESKLRSLGSIAFESPGTIIIQLDQGGMQ